MGVRATRAKPLTRAPRQRTRSHGGALRRMPERTRGASGVFEVAYYSVAGSESDII